MPAKLVSKICWGEYVDMAELLLRDNMEQKKDEIIGRYPPMHLALISSQTGERYHTSQPGFQYFGMHAAMLSSSCPERVHKLYAYQTMIVREAHRDGGKGWLSYD